ncbi:MAG: DUF4350 domain-containing protein [Acidobacteria bacterium]|nr:DUF4350 domain-containing protein [Acidobacteriota bacterium]
MMRRMILGLAGLILVAILGVVLLARPSFRREPTEVPTGWPAKAMADDTLVLERWLARAGWAVRRAGGAIRAADLPPGGQVILMRTGPGGLSAGEAEALLVWVRAGGHLLVDGSAAPLNDARGPETLFSRLDAELISLPEAERPPNRDHTDRFDEDDATFAIQRSPQWRIQVEGDAWGWTMGTKAGQVAVRRPEGQGVVILASDLSFLYNDGFIALDHAAWLSRMLGDPGPGQAAVVWSEAVDPSLLAWLWERAWAFLIACAILLGAWLWAGSWRFGPWLPGAPVGRRSMLEHLVASGRFLWRHGGGPEALVSVARAAVLRRAARLHPAFPELPEGERWTYLATRAGLPESDIAEALDDRPGVPSAVLGRRLQILLHLRQRLFQNN